MQKILRKKFKRFYSYPSISARALFLLCGDLILFEARRAWRFSEELISDFFIGDIESTVIASFKSRWLDLGEPSAIKHGLEIEPILCIEGGGRVMVGVESEGNFARSLPALCHDTTDPIGVKLRFSGFRFKRIRFTVTSYENGRPSIFGATVSAVTYK